jgi:hypothetical protein
VLIRAYFDPSPLEQAGDGRLYRALGVPVWHRLLAPGRAAARWLLTAFGFAIARGHRSIKSLQDARRATCVTEAIHLPFFLGLLGLAIYHLATGMPDLALRYLSVNLLVNGYPIMTQRYTRVQIDWLLRHPGLGAGSLAT